MSSKKRKDKSPNRSLTRNTKRKTGDQKILKDVKDACKTKKTKKALKFKIEDHDETKTDQNTDAEHFNSPTTLCKILQLKNKSINNLEGNLENKQVYRDKQGASEVSFKKPNDSEDFHELLEEEVSERVQVS